MRQIFGIEVTDQQFDYLIRQQSIGKDLKIIDGNVVAVDHEITQEEIKEQRIREIQQRLNQLSQDFIQAQIGAQIDDIIQRKGEFIALHNELRTLLGKEPREYNN